MAYCTPATKITELTNGKDIVEVKCRVIRSWKNQIVNKPGCFYIDMILLDEEGTIIQATVNKNIFKKFEKGIIEGETYKITKFTVTENAGWEMATYNKSRIWFEFSTRITTVDLPFIPQNKFTFTSFGDIIHQNVDTHHYVDIIGEFVEYHAIRVTKEKNEQWTTIDLEDLQGARLSCSIWTPYTEEIICIINKYMHLKERPILVLQYVIPKVFNETISLSTTRGATRIFVNPAIPEVEEFKKRRAEKDDGTQAAVITEASTDTSLLGNKNMIKSLWEIMQIEKAGEYVTKVTILEIDSNIPWYYNACGTKNCRSKAVMDNDELWYCTNKRQCSGKSKGMKSSVARFQVKFFVQGGYDVFAEIMMFDSQIGTLIKESAAELAYKQEKSGDKDAIPIELGAFIDRQVIAKLKVSKQYNLEGDSYCYTVSGISFEEDVRKKWDELYFQSKDNEKSTQSHTEIEDCITSHETTTTSVEGSQKRPAVDTLTTEDHVEVSKRILKIKREKN